MATNDIASLQLIDGVAVVTVDAPPVNTIGASVRHALRHLWSNIENLSDVKAVVLTCKGSTFFSGADITEFDKTGLAHDYQSLLGAIEDTKIPVVAAMFGTVLGGGFEIALACHYRIASPSCRFGFPEANLGLIPGAGGTQRLPRLVGLDLALDWIVRAQTIDADTAKRAGAIDRIAGDDLTAEAVAFALQIVREARGPRRTGSLQVAGSDEAVDLLAKYHNLASSLYPNRTAAKKAIAAIGASISMSTADGLLEEERLSDEAKVSPEALASIHVFLAERQTRKISDIPSDAEPRKVLAAGIVGAGMMGSGIAICFANAGIAVTLVDSSEQGLTRGLDAIASTYSKMVKRGSMTHEEMDRRVGLITGSGDYADLADADLIVEAAFEDMQLKKQIFASIDRIAKPHAVLATNTSTLDIDEIGRATSRPQDVIGMHFFSPANVMPLLEVVRTSATSPETIKTAIELSRPLKKTPVLVKVCYGFVGNRMMEGYAREAERIVLEGATPRQVDNALEAWGMAMGILGVFDMAGIDVGVNVHTANAHQYPVDPTYYQADFALHEAGRLGQKTGKGYYRYEKGDRTRHDDPDAIAILRKRASELQIPQSTHTNEEIVERCLFALINEGFRILDEGIVIRASDIDVVWTSGYGFPRYRGGPLYYAEQIGLRQVLAGVEKNRARFGDMHWTPASLLIELVESGRSIAAWEGDRSSRAGSRAAELAM